MNNPLLTDDLLPKFEHVRTEHMETAIDQILSENRVKIQQLAQQEDPTWETLALPMEALENRLSNAWSVISHLNGVMNNDELRQVYKRCLEKLTEYSTEVSQNAALKNSPNTAPRSARTRPCATLTRNWRRGRTSPI